MFHFILFISCEKKLFYFEKTRNYGIVFNGLIRYWSCETKILNTIHENLVDELLRNELSLIRRKLV